MGATTGEGDIADPLEAESILIESNRQREKTPSERMHEAENLTRIFTEEARREMLAGQTAGGKTAGKGRPKTDDSSPPTLGESYRHERETGARVADTIGMKRNTYAKVKHVHDAANDEQAAGPSSDVGRGS